MTKDRVTIRQVAQRAGVSTATVSRTLHNNPRISERTKRRVLTAARELRYTRSGLAVSTKAVALVMPGKSEGNVDPGWLLELLRGASLEAQAAGYVTVSAFAAGKERDAAFLERWLGSAEVQGVILPVSTAGDRRVELLANSGVPFAVVGRPDNLQDVLWVDNDNFHAMYEVVQRLVERGARRVAFVGGPPQHKPVRDRLAGYRMALSNRGLPHAGTLVAHTNHVTVEDAFRISADLIPAVRPDAVVTTDDLIAIGVLRACAARLTRIPCVGFNNSPYAREHEPGLSSVDTHPRELGREAARLLIDRLEGRADGETHAVIPTRLIVRESSEAGWGIEEGVE